MKFKNYFLSVLGMFFCALIFVGCGGNPSDPENPPTPPQTTGIEITGVLFEDETFTFDNLEHEIVVSGTIPQGVAVQYTANKATNAGTYNAIAVLSGEGYITKTLTATLKIEKADFVGITFENQTFDYDGNEKSIEVEGVLPVGTDVSYSCVENENIENVATETGTYTIKATLTNPNYNTLVLTATLKIKGEEAERHITALNDGTLYFANALHNDYLYKYDGTSVTKVSYDIPYNFVNDGTNVTFISKSLFGSSIKSIGATSVDSLHSAKAEYLTSDGTYFYYVINGLTQAGSGIYKLDVSGSEPVETKIFEGKAKYLNYYDGNLYFADGTNGYKLTRFNLSTSQKTLLRDEKISDLTVGNGYLFYTVNNLIGDYIENYKLSNGAYKKLTIDSGINLTLIGDKLYYINADLFTSTVKGEGIYSVNAYPLVDMNTTGTSLFNDDKLYSSLVKIGENQIAFYRVEDQMLCTYNISNTNLVEVLDEFVAPEETIVSTGSKTAVYDGKIYYLDLHKDKTLNCYDPITTKTRKLTSNKVSDFAIIGDCLYYNTVSYLVNNDLYKIDLKNGGVPELVSKNDCVDVVFDNVNNRIFYVEQNVSGVRTAIHQITAENLDSVVYTKGAKNLRYYDGYIYFTDGDVLYRMPTTDWTEDEAEVIIEEKADCFEISNGVIYYREKHLVNKYLSKVNVDGTGYVRILEDHDPVDIIVDGNVIYFYSDTNKAANAGIYKINTDGSGLTKIMEKTVSEKTYYVTELSLLNNEIYFVNYETTGLLSDSHLYKVSITNSQITKVV